MCRAVSRAQQQTSSSALLLCKFECVRCALILLTNTCCLIIILYLSSLCRSRSKKFKGEPYQLVRAATVDMFPHTDHCEVVMFLARGDALQDEWEPTRDSETTTSASTPSTPTATPVKTETLSTTSDEVNGDKKEESELREQATEAETSGEDQEGDGSAKQQQSWCSIM
eukprot:m.87733 g.87733  ORF g.87733 m.87733 type:complete len:169 (-) comp12248_c0_seq1:1085-1591(-)